LRDNAKVSTAVLVSIDVTRVDEEASIRIVLGEAAPKRCESLLSVEEQLRDALRWLWCTRKLAMDEGAVVTDLEHEHRARGELINDGLKEVGDLPGTPGLESLEAREPDLTCADPCEPVVQASIPGVHPVDCTALHDA
jgi:hypothetical protein